jgi:hypothetical protein
MTGDKAIRRAIKEIEVARLAVRPTLSVRRAAPRAGISETRWRQIVAGDGAAAPAATVLRMAYAVGVAVGDRAAGMLGLEPLHDARADIENLPLPRDMVDTFLAIYDTKQSR